MRLPSSTRSFGLLIVLFVSSLVPLAWCGAKTRVLHSFGAAGDGSVPYGPPLVDSLGNIYGVTINGGTGQCSDYGCGTVFQLAPQGGGKWEEKTLFSFVVDDGSPWGPLILEGNGNLYGTTLGPAINSGVYELSPGLGGWSYSVVYSNGAGPGVVMDQAGNLYGNIGPGNYFGIGAIGELSPGTDGWTYSDLANFNPTVGYSPPAPPVFDTQGNLYGTTRDGGITQPKCWTAFGCGVIFKMTPTGDGTWTYDILHHFASYATDGQTPTSGLLMDNSGVLYGATGYGGAYNQGTIFKFALTNGHWGKSVLYDFPNCAAGCYPGGSMAFDKAGNLYGIADGGIVGQGCGGYTCGVVFRLEPLPNGCWKYNVIHRFIGSDGAFPLGVVVDDRGHLFGTTQAGGTYNSGVAFEISQ